MKSSPFVIPVILMPAILVSCGSPAKRIETGGTSSVTTVTDVDARDLKDAATAMIESLLATGVLEEAETKPARIWFTGIKNDTTSEFPVSVLINDIREELVNSKRAALVMAAGLSKEAMNRAIEKEMETDKKADFKTNFILQGKVEELRRSAGNVKESTFYFSMTLIWFTDDDRDGIEAWTRQASFTKQGTKPSVGL